MRRHGIRAIPALAVIGLAVLSGCSDSGARSLGPVPTAPTTTSTTTVPVSSTVAPATSTSVTTTRPAAGASTVPTTAAPRLVNGIPQVTATPSTAAVGSRVRVEGTGFTDPMWRGAAPSLWLAEKSGCNLFAEATHSITVSSAGRLTGDFTVPATGACRMSDEGERPIDGGSYRIVFACTACAIGELQVTVPRNTCRDVGFAANSDNMASDIVATNMACTDAEALVRKVGAQVRAVGGPDRLEVDGFACLRVSSTQTPLPSSDFECVNVAKKVRFTRT